MSIGIYFGQTNFTVEQYNEAIKRLKKAGAGHPPGRSHHACFGENGKIMVFDVWTSQGAFDKFGKTLVPILQDLGMDPGPPSIVQIHNVIRPPAKVAKKRATAKKRKAPARKK